MKKVHGNKHAACLAPGNAKRQLDYLILTEFRLYLFLVLFHWLKPLLNEGGEESRVSRENLQRRVSENDTNEAQKFKLGPRLEPTLQYLRQALAGIVVVCWLLSTPTTC